MKALYIDQTQHSASSVSFVQLEKPKDKITRFRRSQLLSHKWDRCIFGFHVSTRDSRAPHPIRQSALDLAVGGKPAGKVTTTKSFPSQ